MVRLLAACVLAVCAAPATASAEWQFTPFVGLSFKGSTSIVDPEQIDEKGASERVHRNFGGAVTYLGGGILGLEGLLTWTPGFFQQGDLDTVVTSRTVAVMGNLVITTPRRLTEYSLRPYFSGGFGLLHARRIDQDFGDEPALPEVALNLFGYNVGGGAIGFFSEKTGVRFDVRYFNTVRPKEVDPGIADENRARLRYMTASVGVVIRR